MSVNLHPTRDPRIFPCTCNHFFPLLREEKHTRHRVPSHARGSRYTLIEMSLPPRHFHLAFACRVPRRRGNRPRCHFLVYLIKLKINIDGRYGLWRGESWPRREATSRRENERGGRRRGIVHRQGEIYHHRSN